jgi:hypothetical protein
MKIEYLHASKYGNGAMVAEEFSKQMEDVPSPVELRWRPQVIIRPRSLSHDCLWQGHSR